MKCSIHNIPLICYCPACRGYVEAQGEIVTRKRQAGWKTEGQQNTEKGEAMIYKRGGVYWYKFRWTVKDENASASAT